MTSLQEARVARLAECHRKQKAGYCQDASPKHTPSDAVNNITSVVNNKSSTVNNIILSVNALSSPAIKYWMDELGTKDEATREIYLKNFAKFVEFTS